MKRLSVLSLCNRIARFSIWARLGCKQTEPCKRDDLKNLESLLGFRFRQISLLERAIIHRSYAQESGMPGKDYECLEFLGDSVLDLILSEHLFRSQPDRTEGELSKIRSFLVSSSELAARSSRLGLGRYLKLSYGEEKTGGRDKKAILADVFESIVAAIYLDRGLNAARSFVLAQFQDHLKQAASNQLNLGDFKSQLQERLHGLGFPEPRYRVISELGPEHRKTFLIEVRNLNQTLARAQGTSKKQAEQRAAQLAIVSLDSEESC